MSRNKFNHYNASSYGLPQSATYDNIPNRGPKINNAFSPHNTTSKPQMKVSTSYQQAFISPKSGSKQLGFQYSNHKAISKNQNQHNQSFVAHVNPNFNNKKSTQASSSIKDYSTLPRNAGRKATNQIVNGSGTQSKSKAQAASSQGVVAEEPIYVVNMHPQDTRYDKFVDYNDSQIIQPSFSSIDHKFQEITTIYEEESQDIDQAILLKKNNRNKQRMKRQLLWMQSSQLIERNLHSNDNSLDVSKQKPILKQKINYGSELIDVESKDGYPVQIKIPLSQISNPMSMLDDTKNNSNLMRHKKQVNLNICDTKLNNKSNFNNNKMPHRRKIKEANSPQIQTKNKLKSNKVLRRGASTESNQIVIPSYNHNNSDLTFSSIDKKEQESDKESHSIISEEDSVFEDQTPAHKNFDQRNSLTNANNQYIRNDNTMGMQVNASNTKHIHMKNPYDQVFDPYVKQQNTFLRQKTHGNKKKNLDRVSPHTYCRRTSSVDYNSSKHNSKMEQHKKSKIVNINQRVDHSPFKDSHGLMGSQKQKFLSKYKSNVSGDEYDHGMKVSRGRFVDNNSRNSSLHFKSDYQYDQLSINFPVNKFKSNKKFVEHRSSSKAIISCDVDSVRSAISKGVEPQLLSQLNIPRDQSLNVFDQGVAILEKDDNSEQPIGCADYQERQRSHELQNKNRSIKDASPRKKKMSNNSFSKKLESETNQDEIKKPIKSNQKIISVYTKPPYKVLTINQIKMKAREQKNGNLQNQASSDKLFQCENNLNLHTYLRNNYSKDQKISIGNLIDDAFNIDKIGVMTNNSQFRGRNIESIMKSSHNGHRHSHKDNFTGSKMSHLREQNEVDPIVYQDQEEFNSGDEKKEALKEQKQKEAIFKQWLIVDLMQQIDKRTEMVNFETNILKKQKGLYNIYGSTTKSTFLNRQSIDKTANLYQSYLPKGAINQNTYGSHFNLTLHLETENNEEQMIAVDADYTQHGKFPLRKQKTNVSSQGKSKKIEFERPQVQNIPELRNSHLISTMHVNKNQLSSTFLAQDDTINNLLALTQNFQYSMHLTRELEDKQRTLKHAEREYQKYYRLIEKNLRYGGSSAIAVLNQAERMNAYDLQAQVARNTKLSSSQFKKNAIFNQDKNKTRQDTFQNTLKQSTSFRNLPDIKVMQEQSESEIYQDPSAKYDYRKQKIPAINNNASRDQKRPFGMSKDSLHLSQHTEIDSVKYQNQNRIVENQADVKDYFNNKISLRRSIEQKIHYDSQKFRRNVSISYLTNQQKHQRLLADLQKQKKANQVNNKIGSKCVEMHVDISAKENVVTNKPTNQSNSSRNSRNASSAPSVRSITNQADQEIMHESKPYLSQNPYGHVNKYIVKKGVRQVNQDKWGGQGKGVGIDAGEKAVMGRGQEYINPMAPKKKKPISSLQDFSGVNDNPSKTFDAPCYSAERPDENINSTTLPEIQVTNKTSKSPYTNPKHLIHTNQNQLFVNHKDKNIQSKGTMKGALITKSQSNQVKAYMITEQPTSSNLPNYHSAHYSRQPHNKDNSPIMMRNNLLWSPDKVQLAKVKNTFIAGSTTNVKPSSQFNVRCANNQMHSETSPRRLQRENQVLAHSKVNTQLQGQSNPQMSKSCLKGAPNSESKKQTQLGFQFKNKSIRQKGFYCPQSKNSYDYQKQNVDLNLIDANYNHGGPHGGGGTGSYLGYPGNNHTVSKYQINKHHSILKGVYSQQRRLNRIISNIGTRNSDQGAQMRDIMESGDKKMEMFEADTKSGHGSYQNNIENNAGTGKFQYKGSPNNLDNQHNQTQQFSNLPDGLPEISFNRGQGQPMSTAMSPLGFAPAQ